ncbi:hypothetical protein PQX77_019686, partial [Marasmius sp. AFHP31]
MGGPDKTGDTETKDEDDSGKREGRKSHQPVKTTANMVKIVGNVAPHCHQVAIRSYYYLQSSTKAISCAFTGRDVWMKIFARDNLPAYRNQDSLVSGTAKRIETPQP